MSRGAPPAPPPLAVQPRLGMAHLLALANTQHGPAGHWHARPAAGERDHDHLFDSDGGLRWMRDHHLPVPAQAPSPAERQSLVALRGLMRDLAADTNVGGTPERVESLLRGASFTLDARLGLRAAGTGWPALIADLMPPLIRAAASPERLGLCGNPACRFVFWDGSRGRARRWCDPQGCGNRIRVRRHRAAA